jgi:hypothetical protein
MSAKEFFNTLGLSAKFAFTEFEYSGELRKAEEHSSGSCPGFTSDVRCLRHARKV